MCKLALHLNNNELDNTPKINNLRVQHVLPSIRSIYRWRERVRVFGRLKPFRRQGNKRGHALDGRHLLHLAIYLQTFPKATHAEINSFLFDCQLADNLPPGHQRFFDASQISRAEDRLGLSRKRASTIAR